MHDQVRALLVGISCGATVGMPIGALIVSIYPAAPIPIASRVDDSYSSSIIFSTELMKLPLRYGWIGYAPPFEFPDCKWTPPTPGAEPFTEPMPEGCKR